jgi:hypothetical protein
MNPPNLKQNDWKTPMTLVLSLPPSLSSSTIPTRNRVGEALRNTRSLWSPLIPSRGTIRLENPGSGHSDYQVELDGIGVSGFNQHREPSDTGFPWSHHRTRPPCLWLLL